MRTLLIGGARCGKSTLAIRWANERSAEVCCLVTALSSDEEMAARIEAHRRERPGHWRVREEPLRLGEALRSEAAKQLVLVDCLTVWIANCLWPGAALARDSADADAGAIAGGASGARLPDESAWKREREAFLDTLQACYGDVIIVSNEVGAGIVPDNLAVRIFRDEQGRLNQAVAAICDEVFLVSAGLPLRLKPV